MPCTRPLVHPLERILNAPASTPMARPLVRCPLYSVEFSFTSGTAANYFEDDGGVAYTAQATDPDENPITYGIEIDSEFASDFSDEFGAAYDGSLFSINTSTGAVSFITPPVYDAPVDAGTDNVYQLVVTADNTVTTITQLVSITVLQAIPDGALQQRDSAYIFDRAGDYIVVRTFPDKFSSAFQSAFG